LARAARKAKTRATFESKLFNTLLFIAIIIGLNILFTVLALYMAGWNASSADATVYLTILESLSLPLAVAAYFAARGRSAREMVAQLGLSRKGLNWRSLRWGLALFIAILIMELAIGAFSDATGISLPTNTNLVFCGTPLYFLVFSVVGAPLDEEVLFRGFLVPRIGIILSALIFAVLHAGYASYSEFAAALVFGLLAGYAAKRLQTIYPSIFAHLLVNAVGVLSLLGAGGLC
jgi:hypothetical protein